VLHPSKFAKSVAEELNQGGMQVGSSKRKSPHASPEPIANKMKRENGIDRLRLRISGNHFERTSFVPSVMSEHHP
jgi:hypothetical protein